MNTQGRAQKVHAVFSESVTNAISKLWIPRGDQNYSGMDDDGILKHGISTDFQQKDIVSKRVVWYIMYKGSNREVI